MLRKLQKKLAGIFISFYLLSLSGCVYLVVGTVGALGGYVVSPDTVEGLVTDRSVSDVWKASVDIIGIMGVIQEKNETGGIIIADLQGTKVTVTVSRVSQDTVKLSIKARKALLPEIRTAQDVYSKIKEHLYKYAPSSSQAPS